MTSEEDLCTIAIHPVLADKVEIKIPEGEFVNSPTIRVEVIGDTLHSDSADNHGSPIQPDLPYILATAKSGMHVVWSFEPIR